MLIPGAASRQFCTQPGIAKLLLIHEIKVDQQGAGLIRLPPGSTYFYVFLYKDGKNMRFFTLNIPGLQHIKLLQIAA